MAGHDFVYGELLIGDKGGRRALLADYERMDQAPVVPHAEVVAFARDRKLQGRGIGWIDVHLLASALMARVELWTTEPGAGDGRERAGDQLRIGGPGELQIRMVARLATIAITREFGEQGR